MIKIIGAILILLLFPLAIFALWDGTWLGIQLLATDLILILFLGLLEKATK